MNKLIVFAQHAEAAATLRTLNAKAVPGEIRFIKSEGELPCCYTFDQGVIALSSIGIHAAIMTVAKYGNEVDEIWNLGMAGALHDHLPIGKKLVIETVGKYTPDSYIPPITFGNGVGRLVSSDFPVHDSNFRTLLSQNWDVVDMEGYGVAYAAHYLGKKCRMWKIVSDFASPGGRELIQKNKPYVSELLAETIYEALHEGRSHP